MIEWYDWAHERERANEREAFRKRKTLRENESGSQPEIERFGLRDSKPRGSTESASEREETERLCERQRKGLKRRN